MSDHEGKLRTEGASVVNGSPVEAGDVLVTDHSTTKAGKPLLEVRDLTVEMLTASGWASAVDGVSFDLMPGETLGLVGESGSGKTVTCMAIAGLLPEKQSRVRAERLRLLDHDLLSMPRKQMSRIQGKNISVVFQDPMSSLNPAFTIGDQIREGIQRHQGLSRKQAKARALELLGLVGVPNPRARFGQYPHEFSGGMRQRVMIAIALSCNPEVIIADEPTTALDVTVQAQVLELFRMIQRESDTSIIFVTHDLGVVADVCDRVMVMYSGQIVEGASADKLFNEPQQPYTDGLLAAMPRIDLPFQELKNIKGQPPRIEDKPAGCRFHPRCEYAVDDCRTVMPELEILPSGGLVRCLRRGELTLGRNA